MLNRVLCLILGYSLLTLSIAGPTLAINNSSHTEDRKPSTKNRRELSCPSCSIADNKTLMDAFDGLAVAGRTTQVPVLIPIQRSIREGTPVNFVDTATGHLAFAINDLELAGTMPVVLQRFYSSERREDYGLGEGWSFAFDDRIVIDGDAATLTSGDGSVTAFNSKGGSDHFVISTPQPSLHQSFKVNGGAVMEEIAGLTRIYKKVEKEYRLTQISDSNGNRIGIGFDSRGNLESITGSGSGLRFEWSDEADARLLAVGDTAGRRVSFKHEGRRLKAVIDAAGNHWKYRYSIAGLTTAVDPLGRVLLRLRYDQTGRVVEAGDSAGAYSYDYDSTSLVSRRTAVADPLGVRTVYRHNDFGALTAVEEDSGQRLLDVGYDSANRPTRFLSPRDGELSFAFDEKNRLTRRTTAGSSSAYTYDERGHVLSFTNNGSRTEYVRDARGNVVTATSNQPGQSYRAAYDAQGRLLTIESNAGRRVTNEYDTAGNVTAFTTEKTGRIQMDHDAGGRVRTERFSSGLSIQYERNPRGVLTKRSDNRGHSVTFERDSSGALMGLVRSDNTWVRATRDFTGRIVALNSSAGKTRRFAYDSRGGLTEYIDSAGRQKQFHYDGRGRLGSITDDQGNKTVIQRDEKGVILGLLISNTDGWRYYYDRAGRYVRADRLSHRAGQSGQLVLAGYNRSTAGPRRSAAKRQDLECMFGDDLGINPFTQDGFNCWDPFGGFGGSGEGDGYGGGGGGFGGGGGGFGDGCDYFDPFLCTALSGETYEQCAARQRQRCWNQRNSCFNIAFAQYVATMAVCMAMVAVNPAAAAACMTLAFIQNLANMGRCELTYQNCISTISDRCRR